MLYGPTAVERAMSGTLSWLQAADIIGCSPRTMRRWRARYDHTGWIGGTAGPRPAGCPGPRWSGCCGCTREPYQGFNVRHFQEIARREHGLTLSYSFVKRALQEAGLVRNRRARGRHHQRREPRASFGEMLPLDGSPHPWLALVPDVRQTLLAVLDDATKRLRSAQLVPAETTETVMTALATVFRTHGLPMVLYTDRARWAFLTRRAGEAVNKTRLTQVGRALHRLGVEHIPAYSPQVRGRSERLNRTLQDRLVNELRVAGIRTVEAANAYLQTTFLPHYNAPFTRPSREAASAFVGLGPIDLDQICCHEEERVVGKDNTVTLEGVALQVPRQPGRATCAGSRVTIRRHLDGTFTVWRGPLLWSRYDPSGERTDHVSNQPVTLTCQ